MQATAPNREIPEAYAQARAVKNVLDALERAGKIGEVAPSLLCWYLRDRWRVPVSVDEGTPPTLPT